MADEIRVIPDWKEAQLASAHHDGKNQHETTNQKLTGKDDQETQGYKSPSGHRRLCEEPRSEGDTIYQNESHDWHL